MRRFSRFAVLLTFSLLGFCVAAQAHAAPQRFFDYLYVEANDGASSGGHAAVRFGAQTYHFRYQDGLLRLSRSAASRFLDNYSVFGNRPVHVSRISVGAQAWQRLRRGFEARRSAEEQQLDLLAALREDRSLLRALSEDSAERATHATLPRVRGAGFFAAAGSRPDPGMQALRRQAAQQLGPGRLEARRDVLRQQIRALRPLPLQIPTALRFDTRPPLQESFARAWRDRLAALTAVTILVEARPLRSDALRSLDERLDAAELHALGALRRSLVTHALGKLSRRRPDFGPALLIDLARILALDRSLASGRLFVLDAYADDALHLEPAVLKERPAAAQALLAEAFADHAAARAALRRATDPDERVLVALESSANRALELATGLREGTPLRIQPERLLPGRSGSPAEALWPALRGSDVKAALARTDAQERRYLALLRATHRYHLVERNCVTALFETISWALGGDAAELAQLGGRIDPAHSLAFVPFLSAAAVDAHWHVATRRRIPSYRERRLAELRASEPGFWTNLRELSPLTARSYARNRDDGAFLFFTDGTPWLRPLFGAANVLAGLGESAWGLLRAPADRGHTLDLGLHSVLASLPELGFVNLRKGTNPFVAPKYRVDVDRRPLEDSP